MPALRKGLPLQIPHYGIQNLIHYSMPVLRKGLPLRIPHYGIRNQILYSMPVLPKALHREILPAGIKKSDFPKQGITQEIFYFGMERLG